MSQGTTIKGKTIDGQNVEVRVNDDGTFSTFTTATRLDDTTTANVVYIGKAVPGVLPSSPSWQISRLDTSTGLTKTFADGDSSFNNIWDDRASLTYQ